MIDSALSFRAPSPHRYHHRHRSTVHTVTTHSYALHATATASGPATLLQKIRELSEKQRCFRPDLQPVGGRCPPVKPCVRRKNPPQCPSPLYCISRATNQDSRWVSSLKQSAGLSPAQSRQAPRAACGVQLCIALRKGHSADTPTLAPWEPCAPPAAPRAPSEPLSRLEFAGVARWDGPCDCVGTLAYAGKADGTEVTLGWLLMVPQQGRNVTVERPRSTLDVSGATPAAICAIVLVLGSVSWARWYPRRRTRSSSPRRSVRTPASRRPDSRTRRRTVS